MSGAFAVGEPADPQIVEEWLPSVLELARRGIDDVDALAFELVPETQLDVEFVRWLVLHVAATITGQDFADSVDAWHVLRARADNAWGQVSGFIASHLHDNLPVTDVATVGQLEKSMTEPTRRELKRRVPIISTQDELLALLTDPTVDEVAFRPASGSKLVIDRSAHNRKPVHLYGSHPLAAVTDGVVKTHGKAAIMTVSNGHVELCDRSTIAVVKAGHVEARNSATIRVITTKYAKVYPFDNA